MYVWSKRVVRREGGREDNMITSMDDKIIEPGGDTGSPSTP